MDLIPHARAMVAAKLANMPHGGDRKSDQAANLPLVSQSTAAAEGGIKSSGLSKPRTGGSSFFYEREIG
jgi:hypothetical protein